VPEDRTDAGSRYRDAWQGAVPAVDSETPATVGSRGSLRGRGHRAVAIRTRALGIAGAGTLVTFHPVWSGRDDGPHSYLSR
jgi:hypothetical protein